MKKMYWFVCLLALAGGLAAFGSRYHVSRWLTLRPPAPASTNASSATRSTTRSTTSLTDGITPPVHQLISRLAKHPSSATRIVQSSFAQAVPSVRAHLTTQMQGPFSLPVTFEPNVGQADPRVQWIGRGRGLNVYLTERGIDLQAASAGVLRLALAGDSRFGWTGRQELSGKTNYLIGNDPHRWRTNVPHFARAETSERENSAGLSIYDNGEGLEYDLRLPAGADTGRVRLRIDGAEEKRLASNGDLLLKAGAATVTIGRPAIFQDASGISQHVRRQVDGGFVLQADGSVGICVGPHDSRKALLIDPSISAGYATFLGGSGTDTAASVAIDPSGKVYVGGMTTSASSFPEAPSKSVGPVDGPAEFFVAKIDPSMGGTNSLVYLTFLGGTGTQAGGILAVGPSGNVAITGTTTAGDFPVTGGSLPTAGLTGGQGNDAIVTELDPTGSQLVFSTFFGGGAAESANGAGGIALGPTGNVYIASDTSSQDLPVTAGAMQATWDLQADDGFLAIFAPPATSGGAATVAYCTYLGTNSTGTLAVGGVAVDSSGDAYVAGTTNNTVNGFPATGALQPATGAGGLDAFLMKISPLGQATSDRVYATLLGGSSDDAANAVALDSATPPNAYVAGTTKSKNFPMSVTTPGYQTALHSGASANAFLAVVAQNSNGAATLAYSSYLGGSASDAAQGVAVVSSTLGAAPAVYVAGATNSWDFPWHDNLQPFNGAQDAFVAKLNTTVAGAVSLIYATPLGGTLPSGLAVSGARAIAVESSGGSNRAFVAGSTTAADFPAAITTAGSPVDGVQGFCSSCEVSPPATSNLPDAFVAEIDESTVARPSVRFSIGSVSFSSTVAHTQPVAILNAGEAPLDISGIQVVGSPEFQVTGESPTCQAPVSTTQPAGCSFEISFTPGSGGSAHAVLSVTDDAPGSPQILELNAASQGPIASVSPLNISFGNQPENTSSVQQTITVTNTGNQALVITTVAEVGSGAAQFPQNADTCAANPSLPPGGQSSCVISVSFLPQTTGLFQATINLTDNSAGGSTVQSVTLSGTGVAAAPVALFTPSNMALAYGSVVTQATSATQDVTLANAGSAPLDITSIAITGANQTEFVIVAPLSGSPCSTSSGLIPVATPNASCAIGVQFAPQTVGAKTASLTFADNVAGSPQQVALTGTATSPVSLQVSPPTLSFSAQSEGTSSAAQIVTLTNNGSSPVSAGGVSISGSSDFAVANPCNLVPAGKNCQVSVTLSPAASGTPGNRSGTLNVPGGSPATVALTGAATQSSISLPTSFNFGSQLAGTTGTPQPLTVTNNSSGPFGGALTIATASVPADFSISSDGCVSAATSPGGTCAIQIAFSPQSGGSCATASRTGKLSLTDNAPGSPHSVTLSGTAMDFCFNAPAGQAIGTPLTPGQAIPPYNVQMSSSAGFTGAVSLACVAPSGVGITCAAVPGSVQVTPSTPGAFQVTASTTAGATPPGGYLTLPGTRLLILLLASCLLLAAAGASLLKLEPRKSVRMLARVAQTGALLFTLACGMAACGAGGGAAVDPAATPPGTYTLTVTATTTVGSTSTMRTSQFTFTVN